MHDEDTYKGAGAAFTKEEKLKYSKLFAEGSQELENLLLILWNQGIDTIACCTGHKENECCEYEHEPYFSLSIKGLEDLRLKKILSKLYELKAKNIVSSISVTVDLYTKAIERHILTVHFNKINDNNFALLSKIFTSKNLKTKPIISPKKQRFINAAIDMNSLNMVQYSQANLPREKSYSSINIEDNGEEKEMLLRTCDRINRKNVNYNGLHIFVANGYCTKIKRTGEYVTLNDDKVVSLSEKESKKLPLLNDENLMKKYCVLKLFKYSEFKKDVIDEINEIIKNNEFSTGI